MAEVFHEGRHAGEFLKSEANGSRSRENITVGGGAKAEACTVLGRITDTGVYMPLDMSASDGSEAAAAILYAGVDATDGEVMATGIVRDAELIGETLAWPDGFDEAAIAAQIIKLEERGLIVR